MTASTSNYRPLLSGGLWLAGSAAVIGCLYAIGAGSSIAMALGLQYVLVAFATWAARSLYRTRSDSSLTGNTPALETPLATAVSGPAIDQLGVAVQTLTTVLGGAAVILGLFAVLQLLQLTPNDHRMIDNDAVLGIACLVVAFVWLVLARSFQSISETELPEAPAVMSAFREAQWSTLLAAASLIGATLEPLLVFWITRVLLVWVIAICAESVLRLLFAFLIPFDPTQEPVAPIHLLLREAIFTATNPVFSLIHTFERRCGVSVRSSWAISFVKKSTVPLLVFLILLSWGLTSLSIVETHQMAVREHFGRVTGKALFPGLHVTLPWPFGRIRAFPVKTVQQLPIGFVETDEMSNREQPRALLWTKPHAKEEFALVLGDGSELVAVNAIVYFKIAEDQQEFLDYVYLQSAPEEVLVAFAYRALMEETRGRTLDDVLSANRAAFARRVADSVRNQAKQARLGLEVVDFALLNLHPPIEAGPSYLDVINARLDARRRVTEAEGEKLVALLEARARSGLAVASAKTEGSRRVADALSEVSEFNEIAPSSQVSPRTFRTRLWIEALESALAEKRLFLVDHSLLEDGSELLLDTRPYQSPQLPTLVTPSPNPIPGAN